jgi:hypothetical protein
MKSMVGGVSVVGTDGTTFHYRIHFKDEVVNISKTLLRDCVFEDCTVVGMPELPPVECHFLRCDRAIGGFYCTAFECGSCDLFMDGRDSFLSGNIQFKGYSNDLLADAPVLVTA